MNIMAVAGESHTFTCRLEEFDSNVQLSYIWFVGDRMINTGSTPQYNISIVVLTDARSDYRCAVHRRDNNDLIAVSSNISLSVSSEST